MQMMRGSFEYAMINCYFCSKISNSTTSLKFHSGVRCLLTDVKFEVGLRPFLSTSRRRNTILSNNMTFSIVNFKLLLPIQFYEKF